MSQRCMPFQSYSARQCGTVTVSDHFKAWEAQGWTLGNLTSVHINVEVGGGVGSIDFPVANVTTSNYSVWRLKGTRANHNPGG
jgi:hypothetical protein